jgi:hypothetical protein
MKVVSGNPDPTHISTSLVKRQNLAMCMFTRRFTRLTMGSQRNLRIAANGGRFTRKLDHPRGRF